MPRKRISEREWLERELRAMVDGCEDETENCINVVAAYLRRMANEIKRNNGIPAMSYPEWLRDRASLIEKGEPTDGE